MGLFESIRRKARLKKELTKAVIAYLKSEDAVDDAFIDMMVDDDVGDTEGCDEHYVNVFLEALATAVISEISPDIASRVDGKFVFDVKKINEIIPFEVKKRIADNMFSYIDEK